MTQQINLFLNMPKEEEDKHPVSTDLIFRMSVWVVVFFVLLFGFEAFSYANAWRVLSGLEEQEMLAKTTLDELKAQYPEETKLTLENVGMQIEEEIKGKQLLLQTLAVQQRDMQTFSAPLEGLARQIVAGVWLTTIEIDHESALYRFTGSAFSVDKVLLFIKNLGEDEFYKNHDFKVFEVTNPEGDKQFIQFVLSTKENT